MAGDDGDKHSKQLPPSARKLREARKTGQVPRSPDISGWAVMLVASFAVPALYGWASAQVVGLVDAGVAGFSEPTDATALRLLGQGLHVALLVVAVAAGTAMCVAVITQVVQSRPALAWKKMRPDPKRLSPASGAKKMFSAQGVTQMGKQVAKLALVAIIAVAIVSRVLGMMSVGTVVPLGAVISALVPRLLTLMRYVSVIGIVVGVADWWVVRHQITQQLKMTPREAKEENRREQGSQESKIGRRRAALRLYRARMAGTVKGADVLVVNPTHFAVGLSYQWGHDSAPLVVARGSDDVAAELRADAARLGVPVVTDPPVARAIYGSCLVGDAVPVELFDAIAKLYAQVYMLSGRTRKAS